jgi:hypothetical protein
MATRSIKNKVRPRVDARAAAPVEERRDPQEGARRAEAALRRQPADCEKGDGDAPVEAYLAALPGWKKDVGRRLDALVARVVPGVKKAVRWNTPFYGVEGRGWFLAFHCMTKYVKVTFFRGTALRPVPPFESKEPHVRYAHVFEGEALDEKRWAGWIAQAAALDGERCF